ncbi:uncharacterized protein ACDP82_015617 [Pangshura tecta]
MESAALLKGSVTREDTTDSSHPAAPPAQRAQSRTKDRSKRSVTRARRSSFLEEKANAPKVFFLPFSLLTASTIPEGQGKEHWTGGEVLVERHPASFRFVETQSPAFVETARELQIATFSAHSLSEERTSTMRSSLIWAWILFPGCWALTGPGEVSGPLGGSVSVQCQYDERYQNYKKYWCRGKSWLYCSIAVQTIGAEAEVKRGRVSIQDNRTQCTFTVTMESLALGDQDVYWCGIVISGYDEMFAVNVSVFPAVPTSPPTTPEKDLTIATSSWTVPEVEKSTSSFNSSHAPARFPSTLQRSTLNLILYILIPSVLLVLLLILFIAVKFRRASQRRRKALEDTPGQKDKNVYLSNTNPGHKPPFSASDPAATGQMAIYMNEQHLRSSADPASIYENMNPQRSQISGQRKAVFSGPQDCSATDQQDTYVNMCPITHRFPMMYHQAKCGRKAAG